MINEEWRAIKGYEGLYEVSSLGRIKGLSKAVHKGKCHRSWRERFLKCALDDSGYYRTNLAKNGTNKTVKVHRIVAETFLSNLENKPQVNHKNGIKTDNRIENLEWVTVSENLKHALENKLKLLNGEHNPAHKLSYEDVCYIRSHYKPRDREFGTVGLSKKFGVHRKTIGRVVLFQHWKEGEKDVKNKVIQTSN